MLYVPISPIKEFNHAVLYLCLFHSLSFPKSKMCCNVKAGYFCSRLISFHWGIFVDPFGENEGEILRNQRCLKAVTVALYGMMNWIEGQVIMHPWGDAMQTNKSFLNHFKPLARWNAGVCNSLWKCGKPISGQESWPWRPGISHYDLPARCMSNRGQELSICRIASGYWLNRLSTDWLK